MRPGTHNVIQTYYFRTSNLANAFSLKRTNEQDCGGFGSKTKTVPKYIPIFLAQRGLNYTDVHKGGQENVNSV